MIIRQVHYLGVRSEYAYTAAIASIGLSVAAWVTSLKVEEGHGLGRADRWGIFVGEWAPTFFGLGLALAQYENGACTSRSHSHSHGGRKKYVLW